MSHQGQSTLPTFRYQ